MKQEWIGRHFAVVLNTAIEQGLLAVALVDRDGHAVALAGGIDEDAAMPLAALVMFKLKSADLAKRLFAGDIVSLDLDERAAAVGVAGRQLFVVAMLAVATPQALEVVADLRDRVAGMLLEAAGEPEARPWRPEGGGGDSGPGSGELPLVEIGITISRDRGKA